MSYAGIVLPLPLNELFTYRIPPELERRVRPGSRVIVQFGRRKQYTGIVATLNAIPPQGVEIKDIIHLLDDEPILRRPQMQLWEWVAEYYLCSIGDVMKAALPAGLKIESETFLEAVEDWEESADNRLSEREVIVIQTLTHAAKRLSVAEIEKATGLSGVNMIAIKLIDKGAVMISERLVERYAPKTERYVALAADVDNPENLHAAFDAVKSAPRQEQALLALIELSGAMHGRRDEVAVERLRQRVEVSPAILHALADKGIVQLYKKQINRFDYSGIVTPELPKLSEQQSAALKSIHNLWRDHDINLLHGVTSSGKTEIFIHLIDFVLRQNRQVLYLVPEIALTTQLTQRLQRVFGNRVVIYHSKFTDNERVDLYRRVLNENGPIVVIGARSSIFLPFGALGLVIVDEEHDPSYKQQDPAPRYNARDTAMVLARMHGAKTLLGSATPAVDTYYKALSGRFGLIELSERFGGSQLPEIQIVNLTKARKKGELRGPLTAETCSVIDDSLKRGEQSIVFLNRRGYAPVAECSACGWVQKCECCDVALTYHKHIDRMVCHYCGAIYPVVVTCPACHEPNVGIQGYGTERIEDEIQSQFRDVKMLRMDLDTTRNKEAHRNIINDFSSRKAQILVGTQMVTKGLDFAGVSSVAVVNADAMINQPDFRSAERAFNMIEQVAGRAGRRETHGIVAIQTRQPEHPLFKFICDHDYRAFYDYEIEQRRQFAYPPFTRLIYLYIKHRDPHETEHLAQLYAQHLRAIFGNRVLGPEEPSVGRIQNLYIRKIMLKIEVQASMQRVRQLLRDLYIKLAEQRLSSLRAATIYYDVDPY